MEKEQLQEEVKEIITDEVVKDEVVENDEVEEISTSNHSDEIAERMRELEEMKKDFFKREIAFTLKENGLEAFESIINVKDSEHLTDVVNKLTAIVNDIKVSAGYVPKENAKQAEYDVHAKNKDTKSMIGSKLANLFK